jgi:hypothetical protein
MRDANSGGWQPIPNRKNQPTPSHPVVERLEAALLINREKGWPFLAERPPFLLANRLVVFVAIDATRFLILLCVNSLPILFRQVPVILRTHTALFPVDTGFLVFQARRLTRGQLAALDSVANASLLVGLALVDVIVVCARRRRLGEHRRRRDE